MIIKTKQKVLLIGDILFLYVALYLALLIRFGQTSSEQIKIHFGPFSIIILIWIIIFYITGLYDLRLLNNKYKLFEKIVVGLLIGVVMAVIFFYINPQLGITPKTILALFAGSFFFLISAWRLLFRYSSLIAPNRTIVIGEGNEIQEIIDFCKQHPQVGFAFRGHFTIEQAGSINLTELITREKIGTIIVPKSLDRQSKLFEKVYDCLTAGVEVTDVMSAYEYILKKVPLSEIQQLWLLTNITKSHGLYDAMKRPTEFFIAGVLLIILSPLLLLIWLAIILTSGRPGIYRQIRISRHEKEFIMYKFRTMVKDAEKLGHQWSNNKDNRVTRLGRVLRRSHLDELPQLVNILKGNQSFVGPRPERPEFVKDLEKTIPYYDARHLIKPGITGWAQINYPYGSSVKDAYEKLQYDIYYLKNRSVTFDILIVIKTINSFFTSPN